jgi:hypothetical protein
MNVIHITPSLVAGPLTPEQSAWEETALQGLEALKEARKAYVDAWNGVGVLLRSDAPGSAGKGLLTLGLRVEFSYLTDTYRLMHKQLCEHCEELMELQARLAETLAEQKKLNESVATQVMALTAEPEKEAETESVE